jgi:hypothetical protein
MMSLPGSSYDKTMFHPKLDDSCKARRLQWGVAFWIFWETATPFAHRIQIVLIHMDEKWFYAIAIRKNNKRMPFLGVEPVQHAIHHKSHIPKVMRICSTAFIPHGNDMESGGIAQKLSIVHCGKMLPAQKDSYKRVYKPDDSFHYPKIPANLLRKKGEDYFVALDVNGSSSGTEKSPTFSLMEDYFMEHEFPAMDNLVTELDSKRPGIKHVVRYQLDGAGPHHEGNGSDQH